MLPLRARLSRIDNRSFSPSFSVFPFLYLLGGFLDLFLSCFCVQDCQIVDFPCSRFLFELEINNNLFSRPRRKGGFKRGLIRISRSRLNLDGSRLSEPRMFLEKVSKILGL